MEPRAPLLRLRYPGPADRVRRDATSGGAAPPPLPQQVTLVTGAARGVGAAIAGAFAAEGATVLRTDVRDAEGAGLARALVSAARSRRLDMRREDDRAAATEAALDACGRPDVVANNPGVTGFEDASAGGPIPPYEPEHATLDAWHAVLATNVDGTLPPPPRPTMPALRWTSVARLAAAAACTAACTRAPAPPVTAPVPAPAREHPAAGQEPPRTGRPLEDATTASADSAARIRRVEQGLLPLHTLRGRPLPASGLLARMRYYQVPGVSVAVINGGRVEWARGYGVLEAGGGRPVDARTLFQAASVSKPVTAVGALRLVEQGRLALDADVNAHLRTWRVPANPFTARRPVTLRQLLSHTAGTTVHGFDGYAAGAPVPTVVQVLDGAPPANSRPVRVDTTPGAVSRYSGGGYTVVQRLLGDVTDRPFADVLDALVLRPAGMEHSTFAQPLPAALAGRAAAGHRPDGTPLPGRWHTYPEQAAAGLWTTASDLARLAVTVQQAFVGRSGPVLAPATARQMLTLQPPADSYGLGFGVGGEGGSRFFTHPGGNAGYVANLVVFAETGQGAVVLANREGAVELTHEILRAVARTYGWPATGWNALQPTERVAVTPSPASLRPLAGRYRLGEEAGGPVVIVTAGADGLSARMPDWPAARALYAAGPRRFFFLDNPLELTFEADAGGGAPAAALSAGGPPVRAARVE